jgi:hypothetical protein
MLSLAAAEPPTLVFEQWFAGENSGGFGWIVHESNVVPVVLSITATSTEPGTLTDAFESAYSCSPSPR